jgi:uncharacterized membrane protein
MLHLIHPALVHFTVAFIVSGALVELWGIWHRHGPRSSIAARAERWGGQMLVLGLASLVLTVASGYLAANTLPSPPTDDRLLAAHERNGWILLGLLLAGQFGKSWCGGRVAGAPARLYGALLVAVLVAVLWSAWLGGQMVYVQGIGMR